jgi:O-acetyl-ADP-ribose deacetylase (regulator of RNase III)
MNVDSRSSGVTFGTTDVEVVLGDITLLDVDVVVNAANSQLWMGAGVAGAIKRVGGQVIEDEALRLGPIPVGESVVTSAGSLKARYVIHAAAMGPDLVTGGANIRKATETALLRAKEKSLSSIALPALGTGVGAFPLNEAARLMAQGVRDHCLQGTSLRKVIFAVLGQAAFAEFTEALKKASDEG